MNKTWNKLEAWKLFMFLIVAIGTTVLLISIAKLNYVELGPSFLVFSFLTLAFASQVQVTIPGIKSHISVSDTFIFLAILLYGGEAGILLAALDAIFASIRLSKTPLTFSFNVAVFVVATYCNVWILRALFGSLRELTASGFTAEYLGAICVMALLQYSWNSGLVAVAVALRAKKPIWQMWRENFLWTSVTYFAGASAAGIIDQLVERSGIFAFLSAVPIAAAVYFTYTTYMRNVASAADQAEQAERHVAQLSHHIAEQERISRELRQSEEYFRNAFNSAAGMAVINSFGQWMQVNDSLCSMLGYSKQELLSGTFQAITYPDDLGDDLAHLYQLLEKRITKYQLEKRYLHSNGSVVWVLQSASLVHDAEGRPSHVIFQIQDISDRRMAEEAIRHAAFHDALTGLPNRTMFSDKLSVAVERANYTSEYQYAVIFVDLDRFKMINDSLGHDQGDRLLIELAARLRSCMRTGDTVARLGGDEFAILLDGISSIEEATQLSGRIQSELSQPIDLNGHEIVSTASLGIAHSSVGYIRPEDVLRDADTAMYLAKSNGKARYQVFDRSMHTRIINALTIENELRRSIDRGEIVPYYQPVVELASGKIVGFEALARWQHPERGMVSPIDFISLAEEASLIIPIGLSILRQSCEQLVMWQKIYRDPDLSISVNLSSKQLIESDLVDSITSILIESGLMPACLKLEITETIVMADTQQSVQMINKLKDIGAKISIDDFGTGYSSLSYLHKIPFDVLKIDQSFVSRMLMDKESRSIVKTITALASELEKSVIAEGIEEHEQQVALAAMGCEFGQGYFYSRPLDASSAGDLLSVGPDWPSADPEFPASHRSDLGLIDVGPRF